ncbi:MAG: hypothetical protein Q9163_001901 [Psora crenata]
MALRLFIRDHPARALAVVTETHALVFRHGASPSSQDQGNVPLPRNQASKCLVEFSETVDLSDYRVLRASGVHGILGLINIGSDLFLCIISNAVRVATVRGDETVQQILSVDFYCLNSSDYDPERYQELDPYLADTNNYHSHNLGYGDETAPEHPCQELKGILSTGTFYYSVDFDLTNRLQDRLSEESAFDIDSLDEGYLWNQYMIDPLIKYRARLAQKEKEALDSTRILTSAIRGFVSTITIPPSAAPIKSIKTNLPSALTVISRLSCRRAGTRFYSRGLDDDGNVANFVETESIFWHPTGLCFSYAQVRGSVPLFWEQAAGLLPGQQKIQITRSPEATQPAFNKHFESLEVDYGTVHILNLLSESKPGEAELTARYRYHVRHSPLTRQVDTLGVPESRLLDVQFDFHAETRGGDYEAASTVKRLIQDRADSFAYFLCEQAPIRDRKTSPARATVISQQEGVFRTNCLDCLDRTNLIQTILSKMAMELFLHQRGERATPDFWTRHSSLWADNGDALSKIYAGTGALKSSFTRHGKMGFAGALADARKSATRLYMNNFVDKGRQNTIDMLLGRLMTQSPVHVYDPIANYVNTELEKRLDEYSTSDKIAMWVGTFNVNGKGDGVQHDLRPWLCPEMNQARPLPDIVAVGFQEIVELSPQQIMSTDPVRRGAWEQAVMKTLNENARRASSEEYVLLRSGQLVGTALMVIVKQGALKRLKNVEGSVKKTGMSGMAGNKGAVAIRMDYANTRLCFVTAHLAAGFANYEERNRDYRTIIHGLHFQRNRSIEDHDAIIWAGDFNYRIGLSDEKVRRLAKAGDLDTLYQNDQLNLQMVAGRTFPYYSESRLTFMPTYKYTIGTDHYDSSEKARIPAWCDRLLRKGNILKQIDYATAPLRFSDHRPVFGTFQCTISIIDEPNKERLSREIYAQRKADIDGITAQAPIEDADDQDLIGYDPISPDLPPASSARRKWWLDGGLPSRSNLSAPNQKSLLNSRRPNNPFTPTNEPDWVMVPKGQPVEPIPTVTNGGRSGNAGASAVAPSKPPGLFPVGNSRIQPTPSSMKEGPRIGSRSSGPAAKSSSRLEIPRKPAPPVPKKPHLLSSPGNSDVSLIVTPGAVSTNSAKILDSKAPVAVPPTHVRTNAEERVPPLAQRRGKPPGVGAQFAVGASEEARPPLPPRTNTNPQALSALMDDDEKSASAIPCLQPQSRS